MVACCIYLAILLAKFLLSMRVAAQQRRRRNGNLDAASGSEKTVVVVQPILSGDPNLSDMLHRSISETSSATHFLWMVDDHDNVAIEICSRLEKEFSGRGQTIICEAAPVGENPKTFKLKIAADRTDAEFFVVLDDDTSVDAETIQGAIAALEECDLVTGLPGYESSVGFWSSLLAHFVNNNSVMTYLPLLNFRKPISINGMFYVLRTNTIRQHDVFGSIRDQVCDDYAVARFFRENKLSVTQATISQHLRTYVESAAAYRRQMHRWMVFANHLVQDQDFATQAILIVLLGLPPVLLWTSLLAVAGGWQSVLLLFSMLAIRHLAVRFLHSLVLGWFPEFSWWKSIIAELAQPLQLIGAFLNPRIFWRGKPVRIERDGTFEKPKGTADS